MMCQMRAGIIILALVGLLVWLIGLAHSTQRRGAAVGRKIQDGTGADTICRIDLRGKDWDPSSRRHRCSLSGPKAQTLAGGKTLGSAVRWQLLWRWLRRHLYCHLLAKPRRRQPTAPSPSLSLHAGQTTNSTGFLHAQGPKKRCVNPQVVPRSMTDIKDWRQCLASNDKKGIACRRSACGNAQEVQRLPKSLGSCGAGERTPHTDFGDDTPRGYPVSFALAAGRVLALRT